jgi:hypothetical protein
MKTKILLTAIALAFLFVAFGCKNVTSSQAPNTSVTGEAWYVKETWFLLTWKTQVFYCPKPTNPGPATCIEAIKHEEGEMPAGGGGFGMPAPQPQPAQPMPGGYGQPAPQPQPGAPGYQPAPPPPPPPSY